LTGNLPVSVNTTSARRPGADGLM